MYGNTPYAGRPDAGSEPVDLSPATRRALLEGVSRVARRTREFLPDEYLVGKQVGQGAEGPEVMVSVQPPVGNPVSAGFSPDLEEGGEDLIPVEDEEEVARGLAASAALQVKRAIDGDVPPTAR
ncbi:MAG: DUF5811 family protein [Halodesulfurarchaeum sp.]